MSCDKLVFDLSQEVEGSPNIFIRKDWLNILDNQNTNYQNNQSIIDTSQLSNSNKYMGYREAYLAVPLLLSVRSPLLPAVAQGRTNTVVINDFAFGLKNWFGTLIHSLTLDYNGTTIIQQTPFCNMWNSFKLMTTLSWADVATQGATIGFYPDTSDSWGYLTGAIGVYNNVNSVFTCSTSSLVDNVYRQGAVMDGCTTSGLQSFAGGNSGLTVRTKWIAYNTTQGAGTAVNGATYGDIGITGEISNQMWKSRISRKSTATPTADGLMQISVMATIYLKHLHSFFNFTPLLKGVFMKFTMNLNNANASVTTAARVPVSYTSNVYVGGVQPIMVPNYQAGSSYQSINFIDNPGTADSIYPAAGTYYYDLMVGSKTYNANILSATNAPTNPALEGTVSKSIYLYVPAYTFNPTFEQAYLSNNIKQIKYTDIYQYQVKKIQSSSQFNSLITNGIANIKSVLIIPFYSTLATAINNGVPTLAGADYNEWQSPFDCAGTGSTAPMVGLNNFNVQISGQNAIYNMQRYTFEEWNNQLYGQFAVNGGLTDGLTSGLIDFNDFQHTNAFYYVNVERMLPVEQSVPKSVQIIGTNSSPMPLDFWVFIEYGVQISIDVLTGARV